jgi:hypothetical protein
VWWQVIFMLLKREGVLWIIGWVAQPHTLPMDPLPRRVNPTSISLKAGCELFLRYITRMRELEAADMGSARERLIEVSTASDCGDAPNSWATCDGVSLCAEMWRC